MCSWPIWSGCGPTSGGWRASTTAAGITSTGRWELVADTPASPVKAQVLAQLVRFDMFAARYDPERVRAALDITEALGLDELRAHVLISAGTARGGEDDDEGLDQLMEGLDAARAGNWLRAIDRGATNLSTQLGFRGRERESLEAHHEAQPAVERMGSLTQRRSSSREPDRALGGIRRLGARSPGRRRIPRRTPSASATTYNDISVALARAILRLGRGDLDGAIADQAFALGHARVAKDPQVLYYALAVAVHVHADTRQLERRASASTSCSASTRLHSATSVSRWATSRGRRRRSIARSPPSARRRPRTGHRFRPPARCWTATRARGGDLRRPGAARSAALARLRGGEPSELHRALEFFTRAGATRYAHECERLLVAVR